MDIEALKQIDIVEVGKVLGLQFKGSTNAYCFNGHDKKTASLKFHLDSNQAHCYGCGFHGDTIELVEQVRRCSFMEATRFLEQRGTAPVNLPKRPASKAILPELGTWLPLEFYNNLAQEDLDYFLQQKGLEPRTLDHHLIGRYGDRYSIPVFGPERELLDIRLYSPRGTPKMRPYQSGCGSHIYGSDMLHAYNNVVLCEGEWDRLMLWQHNIDAVTGTAGANTFKDEWLAQFVDKGVYVCYDNDDAGRQGAEMAAAKLLTVTDRVKIITLPEEVGEKGDVSDYFRMYGSSAREMFIDLLRKAPVCKKRATNIFRQDAAHPQIEEPATVPPDESRWAMPIRDFLDHEDEVLSYLVQDIIPEIGITLIHAKPKIGKSLLATNLAIAVAKGDEFLGKATKAGAVLLLQLEDPNPQIRARLNAMGVSSEDRIFIKSGKFQITDKQDRESLEGMIVENDLKLVIVDPFVFSHNVESENDAPGMASVLQLYRELALKYRLCMVIVHHDRKSIGENGDAIRGSGAILSSADLAIGMVKNGSDDKVRLTFVTRNAPVEPMLIELDKDSLVWYSHGQLDEWKTAQDTEKLLQVFRENRESTLSALQEKTGWGYRRVRRATNKLVADGSITQTVAEKKEAGRPPQIFKLKEQEAHMG